MEKCENCGQQAKLYNCKLKDEYGIRYCQLCDQCVVDLRSKCRLMILGDKETDGNQSGTGSVSVPAKPRTYEFPKNPAPKNPGSYNTGAIVLLVAGVIWFIVGIIFYCLSVKELDRESARYLGVDSVANFQGTMFTVGAFLAGVLNIVGGVIVKEISNLKD